MSNQKAPFRLFGRKIKIHLPNGEEHAGQFAIVELDSITASHDERTFAPSPGYPLNAQGRNANDRNYQGDPQAQALVQEYARDLKPELLISTSRTPEGTPIVTTDWIVVSGNNRTMSLKRAARDYPDKYAAYIAFLKEELETFGFKQGEFWLEFQQPILVRVDYDIPEVNTNELAKYNQATTKGARPIDKSIALSARLGETLCGTNIPQIIGAFDTLSEFYDNRTAQIAVKGQLLGCGLVTQQELPSYFDTATGQFNEEGKTFIERTLGASILTADALQAAEADGVKSLRKVVVNALPVLLENVGLTEGNLITYVNMAVLFQQKMVASKLSYGDYLAQKSIFDTDTAHERQAVVLNRLMNAGQRIFKAAIGKYNDSLKASAGESLFGAGEKVTPGEAFEKLIFAPLPDGDKKVIERYFPGNQPADNRVETATSAPEPVQTKGEGIRQIKNPRSGKYVKIDSKSGKIISSQKTPYKGIPILDKTPAGGNIPAAITGLLAAQKFADKTTKPQIAAAIAGLKAAQKFL